MGYKGTPGGGKKDETNRRQFDRRHIGYFIRRNVGLGAGLEFQLRENDE